MCTLAFSPAGMAAVSNDALRNMMNNNPDGAGWAYAYNGLLYFSKGYFKAEKFIKSLRKIPQNAPVMFHARISTAGGVQKKLCHPFRIAENYGKIDELSGTLSAGAVVGHNGCLSIRADSGESDTSTYVKTILQPLTAAGIDLLSDDIAPTINATIHGSRIAILRPDGRYRLFGDGWMCDGGVWYSNTGYKPRNYGRYTTGATYTSAYNYGGFYDWDEYADQPMTEEYSEISAGRVVRCDYAGRPPKKCNAGEYLVKRGTSRLYGQYRGTVYECSWTLCPREMGRGCDTCTERACPYRKEEFCTVPVAENVESEKK